MIITDKQEKRYMLCYDYEGNCFEMSSCGVFEDVKAFEIGDEIVSFRSSEGEFVFVKGEDGKYHSDNCKKSYHSFECVGKRTMAKRCEELAKANFKDISKVNRIDK